MEHGLGSQASTFSMSSGERGPQVMGRRQKTEYVCMHMHKLVWYNIHSMSHTSPKKIE